MGDSFLILLIARAIEGIGSSCVNVCGMSLIAHLYPEDHQRSRIMGIILGSIALGVLIGYPVGASLYDFVSESAPFIIICGFLFTDLAFQLTFFDLTRNEVMMSFSFISIHILFTATCMVKIDNSFSFGILE
jgi:DHA1 family solute carrier family 18 vesicular amine transporter 1/2